MYNYNSSNTDNLVRIMNNFTDIEVYKTGTSIETKIGKIKGIIKEILIIGNGVSYKIAYYNNGFQTVWMEETEFTINKNPEKINIGFKI